MKFKEALTAAGVEKPGRTTWCRIASDGTPVFTIWARDIRQIEGRLFAWWSHVDLLYPAPTATASQIAKRRRFIKLAAENVGRECRAVIVHSKGERWEVLAAEYPRKGMSRLRFRSVNVDAIQFIAELLPHRPGERRKRV